VLLILQGEAAGWWLLVFAGVRALVGVVALFLLTPKLLARRDEELRAAER
jgi:hypothetical protein